MNTKRKPDINMYKHVLKLSDFYIRYKTGPYAYLTAEEKFWKFVNKSADITKCWEWFGKKQTSGYGLFVVNFKTYMAHRVSYLLNKGPFNENLLVCHSCDNPSCVNPNHLWLGTTSDNAKDKISKNRHKPPRGEWSGKTNLTWNIAFAIRKLRQQNLTYQQISEQCGATISQVTKICRNVRWILDLNTYQRLCLERCVYPNQGKNLIYPIFGLCGESGEIAEKVKKLLRGDYKLTTDLKQQLSKELGDVLFYIAVLAFELGYSLSEVANLNINKLYLRACQNKIKGSGDNRENTNNV